eukprot:5491863-Alexandrium_andersonii.AAC.2
MGLAASATQEQRTSSQRGLVLCGCRSAVGRPAWHGPEEMARAEITDEIMEEGFEESDDEVEIDGEVAK